MEGNSRDRSESELMKYIKVSWRHVHAEEPVLLYSELDDLHWETRKVENLPKRKDRLRQPHGFERIHGIGSGTDSADFGNRFGSRIRAD